MDEKHYVFDTYHTHEKTKTTYAGIKNTMCQKTYKERKRHVFPVMKTLRVSNYMLYLAKKRRIQYAVIKNLRKKRNM